ncbi:phenylpropionate dioxygenase-like ring-hydroxylating dioxygenase large terminal subunit [Pseudarthrobacter defluvii]|nr:phenylpropionate dioxygenase-like ring-hydroxylating dioxygenase large terminal subunit [Pseudarthrobacter defluvii]
MYAFNNRHRAALSVEVEPKPVHRATCEQPMAHFGTQDKRAVALADQRAFPLSKGRTGGDSLEPGYPGSACGPNGMCTKVPAQSLIPGHAKVRDYPVLAKVLLWVP